MQTNGPNGHQHEISDIKIIQEQCGEKSLQHRADLETISDRLAGQNRPRRELMAAVETERTTFAEVAGRVQELNDASRVDSGRMVIFLSSPCLGSGGQGWWDSPLASLCRRAESRSPGGPDTDGRG